MNRTLLLLAGAPTLLLVDSAVKGTALLLLAAFLVLLPRRDSDSLRAAVEGARPR